MSYLINIKSSSVFVMVIRGRNFFFVDMNYIMGEGVYIGKELCEMEHFFFERM